MEKVEISMQEQMLLFVEKKEVLTFKELQIFDPEVDNFCTSQQKVKSYIIEMFSDYFSEPGRIEFTDRYVYFPFHKSYRVIDTYFEKVIAIFDDADYQPGMSEISAKELAFSLNIDAYETGTL